jgi:hypothetical protein
MQPTGVGNKKASKDFEICMQPVGVGSKKIKQGFD